jgi:C-terminal processing protease CtpA/Prc
MIKNRLMTLATISFLTLSASANAKMLNPFSNPAKIDSGRVQDVFAGLKFNYLDQEDRLLVLNDFLKQVELEYALLPLKAKRIGLDFKKLKEEARLAELAVVDILANSEERKNPELREKITYLQAQSNLDFLDRMTILVAKFKDTHFSLQEKIARPLMYNGVRLYRIDGKILVGSLENRFLGMVSKISGADLSAIKIGDEVLEIDGVKVEEKINELKEYISGSTEGFIDNYAVRALTLRNFKYEKKNCMKITFKNAGTFKLPLFVNNAKGSTPRLDAITFFEKYKIPSDTVSIGMTFDKATNKWDDSNLTFTGYTTRLLAANLKGVTEYADDAGSPALRTGYFIQKGKTYAVMQLMTFSTKNLKTATGQPLPFIETLRKFIIEVKEQELPLVFDLRVNGGGNGSFPAQVMSLLAPKDTIYAGPTSGYRMTQYMRNIQEPSNYQEIVAEDITTGLSLDEFMKVFDDTLADRKEYTPMMSFGSIVTDPKVGGFNNNIVALVTPDCVSACDKMSFLLKSSGRAVFIGSHSNGTGAGYLSTEDFNTQWEDRLKVLSTQFPNYLFGRPGDSAETTIFGEQSVDELCSENKPTVADIPYASKIIDLAKNNLGWLQKSAQVLDIMSEEE